MRTKNGYIFNIYTSTYVIKTYIDLDGMSLDGGHSCTLPHQQFKTCSSFYILFVYSESNHGGLIYIPHLCFI